jgi:hypothetical protein
MAHIGRGARSLDAFIPELFDELAYLGLGASAHADLVPRASEGERGGAADSFGGAGDEGGLRHEGM